MMEAKVLVEGLEVAESAELESDKDGDEFAFAEPGRTSALPVSLRDQLLLHLGDEGQAKIIDATKQRFPISPMMSMATSLS